MEDSTSKLHYLALAAVLLPAIGVHAAFFVAVAEGHIEWCVPYVDGCTSISRAGRYGLANILFRAFIIPTAAVQLAYWYLARQWLTRAGAGSTRGPRLLPWLGLTAACFLVLYATFLGTEGAGYQLMRRYGINVYFGMTYIAQLLFTRSLYTVPVSTNHSHVRRTAHIKLGICLGQLGLGLLTLVLRADPTLWDRAENILEWHFALLVTLYFYFTYRLWQRSEFRATFGLVHRD